MLFDSQKLTDSTCFMSVIRKYCVRIPTKLYMVYTISAESAAAAKQIILSGGAPEATHQEVLPHSLGADVSDTANWIVEELSS